MTQRKMIRTILQCKCGITGYAEHEAGTWGQDFACRCGRVYRLRPNRALEFVGAWLNMPEIPALETMT